MTVNYKKDMVVYQIYPRSYMDSNGDGVGDIPGIISKLDHIASLGVNAIWLSPVYVSPNDDNGYDIADYKAIQPQFGTMEDFETLVSQAKARGIGIVMDLVINHTSDEHEWFKRALAGETRYQDYYIIREGKDGGLPNNWGNFFAECPWTKFGDTDKYYLHLFSKKQPDLNWRNPAVLEEVKDIMRFWLDKGVIGFRCDVINAIWKDTLEDGKKSLFLTGSEHYLSKDGCHNILNILRREVLDPYGAFTVGETVFVDLEKAHLLTDPERKELDMVFSFEHMEVDQVLVKWFKTRLAPRKLMHVITKWQAGLSWNATYFENHDQPRFLSRFSGVKGYRKECAKMIAGLLFTLRGTPYFYEGQEIGMTNGDFDNIGEIMDIESHNVYKLLKRLHVPRAIRWKIIMRTTRDHARTPMQWDWSENAGFTTGTPWLKVNKNHDHINVRRDTADPRGVSAFFKKMIALRKTSPVLMEGSFTSLYEGRQVYCFRREHEGKALVSVMNMTAKPAKLPEQAMAYRYVIAGNYEGASDMLRPFEFRLLSKDSSAFS